MGKPAFVSCREHEIIFPACSASCKSSHIRQPAGDSLMGSPQNMVLWGEEEQGSECSFRFSGNVTERTLRRRGARGPPPVCRSSDAKRHGHSGVQAVPRRAHIHGRQTMYRSAPLGKSVSKKRAASSGTELFKRGLGDASPNKQMGHSGARPE